MPPERSQLCYLISGTDHQARGLGCDVGAGAGTFGERRIVDLTAVARTYITIAMMLAMAEESVPSGEELPLEPGEA